MRKEQKWTAVAIELNDDGTWTVKIFASEKNPELYAEIEAVKLPEDIEKGDIITITIADGEEPKLTLDQGFWTAEELAEHKRKGQIMAQKFQKLSD